MNNMCKYKRTKCYKKITEHKVTKTPRGFINFVMKRIEQEEKEKRNGKEEL